MTTPDRTFYVQTALDQLTGDSPLPLKGVFLPSGLDHKPDSCTASQQGFANITTDEQRQSEITRLQGLIPAHA